jgi:TolB-like protein
LLCNETVGGSAGSSNREHLLPRIYRKWKDALPDLENAPLFKVLGRKKEFDDAVGKTYRFTEEEKDRWANLFEYKGSEEHIRLRFSVDKLGATLDDVVITYGDEPNLSDENGWDRFTESLKKPIEDDIEPAVARQVLKEQTAGVSPRGKWRMARRSTWRRAALAALICLIVAGAIITIWNHSFRKQESQVALTGMPAFPFPDKPSIAVLPFDNLSGDPEQEYFSDGMTDDLITDLSKISGLYVTARNSTFTYKGKHTKIRQVAKELGVQYVLEGSVRKVGEQVRINAQLVDAASGHHLWAERYTGKIGDVFALQDKITQKIVGALVVKLTASEHELVSRKETDNLQAYDAQGGLLS